MFFFNRRGGLEVLLIFHYVFSIKIYKIFQRCTEVSPREIFAAWNFRRLEILLQGNFGANLVNDIVYISSFFLECKETAPQG